MDFQAIQISAVTLANFYYYYYDYYYNFIYYFIKTDKFTLRFALAEYHPSIKLVSHNTRPHWQTQVFSFSLNKSNMILTKSHCLVSISKPTFPSQKYITQLNYKLDAVVTRCGWNCKLEFSSKPKPDPVTKSGN